MKTTLQAGFCRKDITPRPGMSLGVFHRPPVTEIVTPLEISASVWLQGDTKVAVVGVDIAVLPDSVLKRPLEKLRNEHGFTEVICGASHDHSAGPVINHWLPMSEEEFANIEDLTPEVRSGGLSQCFRLCPEELKLADASLNGEYLELLEVRLVEAVLTAETNLEEVSLVVNKGTVRDVAYSRRIRMRQGVVQSMPGKGNPDSLEFADEIDHEVVTAAAKTRDGRVVGVIVNYGCHATVAGGGAFSGDWPYYLRRTVANEFGPDVVTVFLNGCCGDVGQVNYLNMDPGRSGDAWARILGRRVGFTAIDALDTATDAGCNTVRSASEILGLDYREPGEKNWAWAVRTANDLSIPAPQRWWATGVVLWTWYARLHPEKVCCPLHAIQLGPLAISTNPVEAFSRIGRDIKAESPFEFTMVSELTNGYLGYVPTRDAFGPCGGGYEPWFRFGSYLEIDAARKITRASCELLAQLEPPPPREQTRANASSCWVCGSHRPDEL